MTTIDHAAINPQSRGPALPFDIGFRAILVAISVVVSVSLHELVHLVVGRIVGIPAVFRGLTSAGLLEQVVHLYSPARLALMNGIAPLFTVIIGFVIYRILAFRPGAFGRAKYFFAWWAIFGIPYLGLQMMIIVARIDYSGNGADSAAIAGYFHIPMSVRAVVCVVGLLYYIVSAVWVLGVIRVADENAGSVRTAMRISLWRRVLGWALIVAALVCAVIAAERALMGKFPMAFVEGAVLCWAAATAVLTRWRSPSANVVWKRWLLPGIIGTLALFPLGFIGGGNDYVVMWLLVLPPVVAASMLAAHSTR